MNNTPSWEAAERAANEAFAGEDTHNKATNQVPQEAWQRATEAVVGTAGIDLRAWCWPACQAVRNLASGKFEAVVEFKTPARIKDYQLIVRAYYWDGVDAPVDQRDFAPASKSVPLTHVSGFWHNV